MHMLSKNSKRMKIKQCVINDIKQIAKIKKSCKNMQTEKNKQTNAKTKKGYSYKKKVYINDRIRIYTREKK